MTDEVKDIYSICLQVLKSPGFNHGHPWYSSFGGSVLLPDIETKKKVISPNADLPVQ